MNYVQIDRDLTSDPKVFRLCRLTGLSKRDAVGLLVMLWTWALRHRPDGDLHGLDAAEIEAVCEWEGAPGALLSALAESGFIDYGKHDGVCLHGWMERYEGLKGVKAAAAQRQKRYRNASVTRHDGVSHASLPFVSHESNGGEVEVDNVVFEGEGEVENSSPPTPPSLAVTRDGAGPTKAFKDSLLAQWSSAHGGAVPAWKSDRKPWVLISQLVADYGEAEVARRWGEYLRETGDFFKGHPVGKFQSQFDRWAPQPAPPTEREVELAKKRADALRAARKRWEGARFLPAGAEIRKAVELQVQERWGVNIAEWQEGL